MAIQVGIENARGKATNEMLIISPALVALLEEN